MKSKNTQERFSARFFFFNYKHQFPSLLAFLPWSKKLSQRCSEGEQDHELPAQRLRHPANNNPVAATYQDTPVHIPPFPHRNVFSVTEFLWEVTAGEKNCCLQGDEYSRLQELIWKACKDVFKWTVVSCCFFFLISHLLHINCYNMAEKLSGLKK